jgi:hypothetical protein
MMCDKDIVKPYEMLQTLTIRMVKVLVQRAEEIFPGLKKNMVSVLCMIGIVLSCSLMISVAGVFDMQMFHVTSPDLGCALCAYNTHFDTHNSQC